MFAVRSRRTGQYITTAKGSECLSLDPKRAQYSNGDDARKYADTLNRNATPNDNWEVIPKTVDTAN